MTQSRRSIGTTQKVSATFGRDFRTFLLMSQFEARDIGERIALARNQAGMTQDELAALASFSKRSLQDYEGGVTIPYKHLREIGRLLRREPDWFLHGDPDGDPVEDRVKALEVAVAESQLALADVRALQEAVARIEAMIRERLDPPQDEEGSA